MEASIASFSAVWFLGSRTATLVPGPTSPSSRRRLASGCSEVLGKGHGVVGGQLSAAGEHLLDSLVEPVTSMMVAPRSSNELAVVAGGALGGAMAGDFGGVLQARVLLHAHAGTGVHVGHRRNQNYLLRSSVGCHVIEHDVVAARVHAGDKRVPGVSMYSAVTPRSLARVSAMSYFEAGELTGGVVVGVGAVGTSTPMRILPADLMDSSRLESSVRSPSWSCYRRSRRRAGRWFRRGRAQ